MDKKTKIKTIKLTGTSQMILGFFLSFQHGLFRQYIDFPGLLEHEWIGWILFTTGMLTLMLNLPHKKELDKNYFGE